MESWQRQRIATQLAPLVAMTLLGIVFYRSDRPFMQQMLMRPLVVLGMLALAFGPVLIGLYFGRRRSSENTEK